MIPFGRFREHGRFRSPSHLDLLCTISRYGVCLVDLHSGERFGLAELLEQLYAGVIPDEARLRKTKEP